MLKKDENNWLAEHQKHCVNFTINNDFIQNNLFEIEKVIDQIKAKPKKNRIDIEKELLNSIVKSLNDKILSEKNIGLMCSGGEDSIYLLIILVKYLFKKPKLFCYETKNNQSDVRRLKKIATLYDLELNLFNSSNLGRKEAFEKFVASQRRVPNDLAQPVHNALYFEAVENHGCKIVVDGQFCDTVLLSNPQNHFLLWFEKYPLLLKTIVEILNLYPFKKSSKIGSRLLYLRQLYRSDENIDIIFDFINLKYVDPDFRSFTMKLVKEFGIQFVFSAYFFHFLLKARERDKYLICPLVFSPFDNFEYAEKVHFNINQVLGLIVRKKPIRSICIKYFPKLFRYQNTLPFELE